MMQRWAELMLVYSTGVWLLAVVQALVQVQQCQSLQGHFIQQSDILHWVLNRPSLLELGLAIERTVTTS